MRVLVPTGDQAGLARFVQASTTMTNCWCPVMVNPNRFVRTPTAGNAGLHLAESTAPSDDRQTSSPSPWSPASNRRSHCCHRRTHPNPRLGALPLK